jgi:preprotein translocase subunit SecA
MHSRPKDYGKAEELLRGGYSTPDVRDRDAIAQRLQMLCKETGRFKEAREFARQATQPRRRTPPMSVSRELELEDDDDAASVHDRTTVTFGDEGLPLDRLAEIVHALETSRQPVRAGKVGRNAPCPCGSGKKFKKCCGSGQPGE